MSKYNDKMISLKGSIEFYENLIKKRQLGKSATKRLNQLKLKLTMSKLNKSSLYKRILERNAIKDGI